MGNRERHRAAARRFAEAERRRGVYLLNCYVDIAGGTAEAILLSAIEQQFSNPAERIGTTVFMDGREWIACAMRDWWHIARLTAHQYVRAVSELSALGFVTTSVHKLDGAPATYISLNHDRIRKAIEEWERNMIAKITGSMARGEVNGHE